MVKNPPASAGDSRDSGSIPGSGRCPRGGNGNLLQCSCLGNPMGTGAWWATVHGVTESQARLSTHTALPAWSLYVFIVGFEGTCWPQFIMSCLGACARGLLTFILII